MTEEEFQEDIDRFGTIELTFYADGRMRVIEGNWTEVLGWSSEDGVLAIIETSWGEVFTDYADYYVSGQYLTIIPHDDFDDYLILRRWDGETSTIYGSDNSLLLGRWEAIRASNMTEEEFQEEIDRSGTIELTFYADGRMWMIDGNWIEMFEWVSEDGVLTVVGLEDYIHYYISGQYLTIAPLDDLDDYLILRRME